MSKTFVGIDLTTVNSGQSLKYENGDWVAYSVSGISYSGITTSSDSYQNLVLDLTTGLIATEPIYNVLTDVIEKTIQTPPTGNTLDDAYIIPSGSTGDWSGQTNNVAMWDGSMWGYYTPQPLDITTVLTGTEAGIYKFSGGTWILKTQPVSTSWLPIGNALTSTGKIGSTTNYDVQFISNNIVRGVLLKDGRFGFGQISPNTTVDINGSFSIRNNVATSIGVTGIISSVSSAVFISGYSTPVLNGLDAGSAGKIIYIGNKCGVDITIKDNNTGTTASYRIMTGVGDVILKNNNIIQCQYDSIVSRWRLIGKNKIDYNTDITNLPTLNFVSKTGDTMTGSLYLPYLSATTISATTITINNKYSLPTISGASGYVLTSNGNGTTTWSAATSAGLTIQPFITLVSGATTVWNLSSSTNAQVTISGNTILSINNTQNGIYGTIKIIQGTSGNTLTLPANSKVANGGSGQILLSSLVGSVDILSFVHDGTNYWWNAGYNYN